MRIDGFQNIPAILQSLNAEKAIKASKTVIEEKTSSVSLSSFAETLQSLQREASKTASSRSARVDELSQQAQGGDLSVDLNKLAENLVDSHIINFKG